MYVCVCVCVSFAARAILGAHTHVITTTIQDSAVIQTYSAVTSVVSLLLIIIAYVVSALAEPVAQ
jgi:hypothetical protein